MVNSIKNINTLHNNIFVFSPIVFEFYKNYKFREKNILLSYLLLPMILDKKLKTYINKISLTSSIFTLAHNNKNLLLGLQLRIRQFYKLTNDCLQYLVDIKVIEINNLEVTILNEDFNFNYNDISDELTAAQKITTLFKNYDIVTIFRTIGVKTL